MAFKKFLLLVLLVSILCAGTQWCQIEMGLDRVGPLKQGLEASKEALIGLTNTIRVWHAELTTWLAIWYFRLEEDKSDPPIPTDKIIKLSKIIFFQNKKCLVDVS